MTIHGDEEPSTSVRARFNVHVMGPEGAPPIVFAHGFGCDQSMWRKVAPAFAHDHRVVLFDHLGAGGSDVTAYDAGRYDSLAAYADDVVSICHELGLRDVVFVGHSVSSMIGVLAHLREPELFRALVLVGPSARYLNDDGYRGGFDEADITDLLELMDSNHLGWQDPLSGMVMDAEMQPGHRRELEASFCRVRPDIAAQFARVTFLADNRDDLARVTVPTLVLQNRYDAIAPMSAGEHVHEEILGSRLVVLDDYGHCPHLSSPDETVAAIRDFLAP